MKVKPPITEEELNELTTLKLADGRVHHQALPAVSTDAEWASKRKGNPYKSKWHDPKGHDANRKLAKAIAEAVKKHKTVDKDGHHFILAWRMYPNGAHPRWQREEPHSCGCGCGCGSLGKI